MLAILLFVLAGEPVLPDLSPDRAMRIARDALAKELGVPARRIRARDVERAEWPDASLGCPEKGVQYAQVVTTGYRMRLEIGEKSYTMHVAGDHAIHCDARPRAGAKGLGSDEVLTVTRIQQMAREHLAQRLKVDAREVRARSVRPAAGAERSCSAAAAAAEPPAGAGASTGGWIVVLQAGGRTYRYHGDGQRVVPCDEPAG